MDVNDLKRDAKLTEYMQLCHYFALPNDQAMLEATATMKIQQIGILCVTDKVVDGQVVYMSVL